MDEQEVIDKILNGDTEEYRHLVVRYQTGLIIYLENIVKNRFDAEDIAQEAFVKAYRQLGRYDGAQARFSTWLYRIAANCAVDQLRATKNKQTVAEVDFIDTAEQSELYFDEISDIRHAIDSLEPPKFAEIIRAYYWKGQSYQEIAEAYGTSTNTVGTWVRRAKLQLREELS